MDTTTSDIRAVEFIPSSGNSPVLPELLEQIPEGEEVGTVTADGDYDARGCNIAIIDRHAPAIIPIRVTLINRFNTLGTAKTARMV